jgi:hypothetical protein
MPDIFAEAIWNPLVLTDYTKRAQPLRNTELIALFLLVPSALVPSAAYRSARRSA